MFVHLEGEIPAFRAAQASGMLEEFWPNMHVRFRREFKRPGLTDEEIAAGMKLEDIIRQELMVSK